MKKIKIYTLLLPLVSLSGFPAYAGNIYRFLDHDGVSTLSRTLPPYAAQQGYEILDDKTFRVLKRVLTQTETIEQHKAEQAIAQKQQQEQKLKQEQQEQQNQLQKEQAIADQNLLDMYTSVEDIIKARDSHQVYLDKQIEDIVSQKAYLKDMLHRLQQAASEQELSGQAVSKKVTHRIDTTQQDIIDNQLHFKKIQEEKVANHQQYEQDIIRLRELQGITDKESLPLTDPQN